MLASSVRCAGHKVELISERIEGALKSAAP
jgi:hypothetical protein